MKKKILLSALLLSTALSGVQLIASDESAAPGHARAAALPADFNPRTYTSLHPDLKDYADKNPAEIAAAGGANQWAINHYLSWGKKEGREYRDIPQVPLPANFNPRTYAALNPDLLPYYSPLPLAQANQWATQHYLIAGIKEGREYRLPREFDPFNYAALYEDLLKVYCTHTPEKADEWATEHYLFNGRKEGRAYAPGPAAAASAAEVAKLYANIQLVIPPAAAAPAIAQPAVALVNPVNAMLSSDDFIACVKAAVTIVDADNRWRWPVRTTTAEEVYVKFLDLRKNEKVDGAKVPGAFGKVKKQRYNISPLVEDPQHKARILAEIGNLINPANRLDNILKADNFFDCVCDATKGDRFDPRVMRDPTAEQLYDKVSYSYYLPKYKLDPSVAKYENKAAVMARIQLILNAGFMNPEEETEEEKKA